MIYLPYFFIGLAALTLIWPENKKPRVKIAFENFWAIRNWINQQDIIITKWLLSPESRLSAYYDNLLRKAGRPWGITPKEILLTKPLLPVVILLYISLKNKIFEAIGLSAEVSLLSLFVFSYSFLAFEMVLIYLGAKRERRINYELSKIYAVFRPCVKTGARIDQCLLTVSKNCVLLREPIQRAVNQWTQGSHIAIKRMIEEVEHDEFTLFGVLVADAIDMNQDEVDGFLRQHEEKLSRFKQSEKESRKKGEEQLTTVSLAIPVIIIMIVTIYPVYQLSIEALNSFRLLN